MKGGFSKYISDINFIVSLPHNSKTSSDFNCSTKSADIKGIEKFRSNFQLYFLLISIMEASEIYTNALLGIDKKCYKKVVETDPCHDKLVVIFLFNIFAL